MGDPKSCCVRFAFSPLRALSKRPGLQNGGVGVRPGAASERSARTRKSGRDCQARKRKPPTFEMTATIPSFRPASALLVMLSLSVGWGIRGNYGHEAGAMIPGALAAIAAALTSGREDWRGRVPYFAFFGALGWAFGGSISYMHPPSYTETGQLATQIYGFLSTFFEAFLWAGLGGAATAYAAVEDEEKLTAIFRPLLWVFGAWTIQYILQDTPYDFQDRFFQAFGGDRSEFRQRDPLYWLDSEWLAALYALARLCVFC